MLGGLELVRKRSGHTQFGSTGIQKMKEALGKKGLQVTGKDRHRGESSEYTGLKPQLMSATRESL